MKKLLIITIIILHFLINIACNSIKNIPVIKNAQNLSKHEGKIVTVIGKLSDVQWQRTIQFIETHPVVLYFDMNDMQIVIYSKKEIHSKKTIKVTGKVIKVIWESKKAGENNKFAEYHIILDKYEIVK